MYPGSIKMVILTFYAATKHKIKHKKKQNRHTTVSRSMPASINISAMSFILFVAATWSKVKLSTNLVFTLKLITSSLTLSTSLYKTAINKCSSSRANNLFKCSFSLHRSKALFPSWSFILMSMSVIRIVEKKKRNYQILHDFYFISNLFILSNFSSVQI